jgi:hypothetical protein
MQQVTVTHDPGSPATVADVRAQYALLRKYNDGTRTAWDGYQQVEAMRAALKARVPADSTSDAARAIAAFRAKVDTVGGNAVGGGGGPRRPPANFYGMNAALALELTAQDNADQAPTAAMIAGYAARCRDLRTAVERWTAINSKDLVDLNAVLGKNGIQTVPPAKGVAPPVCVATVAR